ncbi:hypothetical protein TH0144_10330 [Helicobacter pylori]
MEKILAFFIPSFFSSLSGGITYKPTLNFLESPKSLAFFKSLFFGVESLKKDRKKKKQKHSNITDAAILGSTSEESALYANANKEHLAILDDKTLGRTLEGISKYKVNPKYQYQNINQQAGYSAEIKEQAHANAHNILMKNGERLVQYDNLSSRQKAQIKKFFPDYATPNKNHEFVDYVRVDRNGNVIANTLTQSKFVGKDGAECFEKFLSKDL